MTQAKGAIRKVQMGSTAISALAIGAVAFGAAAIGALAVGAMTIRRLRVLEARIERAFDRHANGGSFECSFGINNSFVQPSWPFIG